MFELCWTKRAEATFKELKNNPADKARYKAVKKTVDLLLSNPRHPSLQTYEWLSERTQYGEKIFEAYAQQKMPGAYRVFFCYGPSEGKITILAITPHP